MTNGMFILMSDAKGLLWRQNLKLDTIELVKLLPFTSRGAAGGGGSASALRAHLPPHQGEALRGHTLPEGDVRDTQTEVYQFQPQR